MVLESSEAVTDWEVGARYKFYVPRNENCLDAHLHGQIGEIDYKIKRQFWTVIGDHFSPRTAYKALLVFGYADDYAGCKDIADQLFTM